MKQEVKTILETPFTTDQVKQRKGLWGKTLDYIEGHSVIARLNDAFDSDWSFSVIEHRILDDEVVVLGRLQVGDITKEQFGGSNITRDSSSGKTLCLADDLKGAATDSLKKCATLLGVALSLFGDSATAPNSKFTRQTNVPSNGKSASATPDKKPDSSPKQNDGKTSDGNGGNGNNGNGESLITPKQMRYILSLGHRRNMSNDAVEKLAADSFGIPLYKIGKTEASELITQLSA